MNSLTTIEEFCEMFPESSSIAYIKQQEEYFKKIFGLKIGFVPWDDSAICWGGPYDGDHVLMKITDARLDPYHKTRGLNSIEHLCSGTLDYKQDFPTIEKPIRLQLSGNDDCSYSAFFADRDHAEGMLENILMFPTWDSLHLFGFVFTN